MNPGLTSWLSRSSPTSLSSRRAADLGAAHSTPRSTQILSSRALDASDSYSRGSSTPPPSASSSPESMLIRRQGGVKSISTGSSSGPLAW